MGKGYILAVDQSTSGSKAIVVNIKDDIIAAKSKDHKQSNCLTAINHLPSILHKIPVKSA